MKIILNHSIKIFEKNYSKNVMLLEYMKNILYFLRYIMTRVLFFSL